MEGFPFECVPDDSWRGMDGTTRGETGEVKKMRVRKRVTKKD